MKKEDAHSKEIIGAAIEVHRHLGPGLLESAYEECLCRELAIRGISLKKTSCCFVQRCKIGLWLSSGYCRRAKSKGWKIVLVEYAEVIHYHSITDNKMPLLVEKYAYQSNVYFLKKYYGSFYSNVLKRIYQMSFIVKIIQLYIQMTIKSYEDRKIIKQISRK